MRKIAELFTVAVFVVVLAIPVFAVSIESMEIPSDGWVYDAVAQLAAKGYFEDYPDGLDGKPITRGKVAYMLANALPVENMTQVSEEDADMLERLVDEFRAELENHGVREVRALDDVDKMNPTWFVDTLEE